MPYNYSKYMRTGSSVAAKAAKKRKRDATVEVASKAYVKKLIATNLEEKVYNYAVADVAVNTTGDFVLLNGLSKGTDLYGTRIGAEIRSKYVEIRGLVGPNWALANLSGAMTVKAQVARLMIVRDTQPNNAVFSLTDLLSTATALSLESADKSGRYKILLDQSFPLAGGYGSLTGPSVSASNMVHSFHYKFATGFKTEYNNGNAGTVADIDKNSLYMLWVGSVAASNDYAATAKVGIQHYYTDA